MMDADLSARIDRATSRLRTIELSAETGIDPSLRQMPMSASVGVAYAIILLILLWPTGVRHILIAWLATGVLLAGLQMILAGIYRRAGDSGRRAKLLRRLITASIGASGLYWGYAGGWFYPDASPVHQILLAALLAMLCASTVTLYSSIPGAAWLFAIPALAPVLAHLAMNDATVYGLFCIAIVIAVSIIARFGADSRRALGERRALQLRNAELAYHASHDPLVGLPNPREFKRRLAEVSQLAETAGFPYALIYVDLDDFKSINDQYGHGAGDELLIATAHALKSMVRSTDTAGRIGGDEFVVLLVDCPQHQAARIAEAIRTALNERLRLRSLPEHVKISASLGVAYSTPAAYSAKSVIRAADAACYAAKEAGKNTVVVRQANPNYEETGRFELRDLAEVATSD